jgi:hypothetical protein
MGQGERLVETVLTAAKRSEMAAQETKAICEKYGVSQVVIEERQNGVTTKIGIQWVPTEMIQGAQKPMVLLKG